MVAVGVLAIAIFALLATLIQSSRLRQVSAETEVASSALQTKLAEVRSADSDLGQLALQDATTFTVDDPRLKDAAGLVEILDEDEASAVLRSDVDGDGDIDGDDLYDLDQDGTSGEGTATDPDDTSTGSKKTDYARLVPIRVTLTWQSAAGEQRSLVLVSFAYPSETQ
jgi:type II secretory pathway pseudopilin PulG